MSGAGWLSISVVLVVGLDGRWNHGSLIVLRRGRMLWGAVLVICGVMRGRGGRASMGGPVLAGRSNWSHSRVRIGCGGRGLSWPCRCVVLGDWNVLAFTLLPLLYALVTGSLALSGHLTFNLAVSARPASQLASFAGVGRSGSAHCGSEVGGCCSGGGVVEWGDNGLASPCTLTL